MVAYRAQAGDLELQRQLDHNIQHVLTWTQGGQVPVQQDLMGKCAGNHPV